VRASARRREREGSRYAREQGHRSTAAQAATAGAGRGPSVNQRAEYEALKAAVAEHRSVEEQRQQRQDELDAEARAREQRQIHELLAKVQEMESAVAEHEAARAQEAAVRP
jgi:hypothetical protein